ncbi:MAG: hypothetical protein JO352_25380 [Chloroflexi bacterium]|nr:hypothetical protein [Chloroflexota bacterium]
MVVLGVTLVALLSPTTSVADPLTSWTPGPSAVLDNTYDGYIDVPAPGATVPEGLFMVSGWFIDTTADGWSGADSAQVWLGTMDSGLLLAAASTGESRPDVAAALGNPFWATCGFEAFVPAYMLAPGPATLSVYVHTPAKGWWYRQVNVVVSSPAPARPSPNVSTQAPVVAFERPRPDEIVPSAGTYEISGYALDVHARPDAGAGIGEVKVYMGDRDGGGTLVGVAELGRNDSVAAGLYGPQFASAGWRLLYRPTRFHTSDHVLYAYAVSAVNGKEGVAQRYFTLRDTSQ